jgi:hypothetical protein
VIAAIAIGALAIGALAYVIRSASLEPAPANAVQPVAEPAAPAPPAPEVSSAPIAPAVPAPAIGTAAGTATDEPGTAPQAAAPDRQTQVARSAPPPAASSPARAAVPSWVFDGNAVVADGNRFRERNARIMFDDGTLTIVEQDGTILASHAFDTITGISYSTTRHPLWNSPDGPAELLEVEGGAFGIRRGGRNWVAFATTGGPQVIRVKDEDIRGVISAIQAHTGRPVVRVLEKRD